jgi:hypothetical protein
MAPQADVPAAPQTPLPPFAQMLDKLRRGPK